MNESKQRFDRNKRGVRTIQMKQTNLSLSGILFGLFISCSAGVRYFILLPDIDKGLFFGLLGLIIIAISWNYAGRIEIQKQIDKLKITITDVEQYIADNLNKKEVK